MSVDAPGLRSHCAGREVTILPPFGQADIKVRTVTEPHEGESRGVDMVSVADARCGDWRNCGTPTAFCTGAVIISAPVGKSGDVTIWRRLPKGE